MRQAGDGQLLLIDAHAIQNVAVRGIVQAIAVVSCKEPVQLQRRAEELRREGRLAVDNPEKLISA